ncbi:sodium channel protein Nach [Drosophila ananassae]|uniref:sodium channel protein Nach n=1 Tax=Drosophila ananassae TaxID=7217 RepID=UPI001CFF65A3|nr:sodium channel protein Nach [Drosophila ananassae]
MAKPSTSSNAIWWIKNPKAEHEKKLKGLRKNSLGSAFCLDMRDLLKNISLQGYNKLLSPDLTFGERSCKIVLIRRVGFDFYKNIFQTRLIWLLLHTVTAVSLVVVLSLTWEQFVAQSFVTNLKDPLYPVENVPFPAVSICTNNRISRKAAIKYAEELQLSSPITRPVEYYLERLNYLREFYVHVGAVIDSEDFVSFQTFLDVFGTWQNETFFDTRRIMKMLTPSCQDYVLKCTLANVDVPCQSAFQETLTMYGPCCTFNTENKLKKRNFKNRLASPELGLTVVLNSSHSDYFSPILNTNGYIVLIHNADDYATVSSSNTLEMFPGQGEDTYLQIYARVVDTDDSLKSFSPFGRRCYFEYEMQISAHEQATNASGYVYTFPNCITRCRIRSIIALCRCLPFQFPLQLVENLDGVVYCTLSHLPCINQYMFKWRNVMTERHLIQGLEREIEEALYCPQCLPSCNDVQYRVSMSSLPIDNYLASLKLDENNQTQFSEDISVLRVYFGDPNAQYYIRLLNNAWFEIFSTIGNIMSIFVGFCMVAIFEILFFFTKYIYQGCNRIVEQNIIDRNAKKLEEKKLYICP